MTLHPNSRGWRSTKLHLALITVATITLVYVHAGCPPGSFEAFALGVLGASGIYSSASVSEKFAKVPPTPGP